MEKTRTQDIYYGAYLLTEGSKLKKVKISGKYNRTIIFEFEAPEISTLMNKYYSGKSLVNVLHLRSSINLLRDIVHDKLNENESKRMRKENKDDVRIRRYTKV